MPWEGAAGSRWTGCVLSAAGVVLGAQPSLQGELWAPHLGHTGCQGQGEATSGTEDHTDTGTEWLNSCSNLFFSKPMSSPVSEQLVMVWAGDVLGLKLTETGLDQPPEDPLRAAPSCVRKRDEPG